MPCPCHSQSTVSNLIRDCVVPSTTQFELISGLLNAERGGHRCPPRLHYFVIRPSTVCRSRPNALQKAVITVFFAGVTLPGMSGLIAAPIARAAFVSAETPARGRDPSRFLATAAKM